MSLDGTDLYELPEYQDVPPLVERAVTAARELDFALCVHPRTGRLLQVLASGVPSGGRIGETGTGTGAGLAWMASTAPPDVSFVSVENDPTRAAAAQAIFEDHPNVTVLCADAGELFARAPFDMLVHDGGWGSGKSGDGIVDPDEVLVPGGVMTVDDYTPMDAWPPMFKGAVDQSRVHWLTHPSLLATEIRVAPTMSVIVGRRIRRDHA